MMESSESLPPVRKSDNWGMRIINFFSSLGLATVLLLLLGVLTWLATLEQIGNGLYPTLNKYFSIREWYVIPEIDSFPHINGRPITIPLPGGYWVCALLLLNLTLGGILRMRKGWKKAGILIAHFGIIFMIVGLIGVATFSSIARRRRVVVPPATPVVDDPARPHHHTREGYGDGYGV